MKKLILIDAGHGGHYLGEDMSRKVRQHTFDDSTLYEGLSNRAQAAELQYRLALINVDSHIITETTYDAKLKERTDEVNKICRDHSCFLISIHSNGFEKQSASGWECFTYTHASKASEIAALIIEHEFSTLFHYERYKNRGIKRANFAMLRSTKCPAVLTEDFFMTNREDFKLLTDSFERSRLIEYKVKALLRIYNEVL